MTQSGHVGGKHPHLAVFDASGAPAVLRGDARGVASPFGEAAFIKDEHRKGGVRRSVGRLQRWWLQALTNQGAQIIAHAVFIPDGTREQTLHARRTGFSSLFSDLPAIFARDIAQDGL